MLVGISIGVELVDWEELEQFPRSDPLPSVIISDEPEALKTALSNLLKQQQRKLNHLDHQKVFF